MQSEDPEFQAARARGLTPSAAAASTSGPASGSLTGNADLDATLSELSVPNREGEGEQRVATGTGGSGGGHRLATVHEYNAIRQSLAALRQRMHHLENIIAKFAPVNTGDEGQPSLYAFNPAAAAAQSTEQQGEGAQAEGADGDASRRPSLVQVEPRRPSDGPRWDETDSDLEASVALEAMALGKNKAGAQAYVDHSGVTRRGGPFDAPAFDQPAQTGGSQSSATAPSTAPQGQQQQPAQPPSASTPTSPDFEAFLHPAAASPAYSSAAAQGATAGKSPASAISHSSSVQTPAGASARSTDVQPTQQQLAALQHQQLLQQQQQLYWFLPDMAQGDFIVRFSLERLAWHHGALHAGRFLNECAEFNALGDDRWSVCNPQWLALYFAVLCVAARHMGEDVIMGHLGMTEAQARALPREFFAAAIAALQRGEFLTKPSLNSVQMARLSVFSALRSQC